MAFEVFHKSRLPVASSKSHTLAVVCATNVFYDYSTHVICLVSALRFSPVQLGIALRCVALRCIVSVGSKKISCSVCSGA